MPFLRINNCNYYYEIHGEGKETILFSHGLLWSGFLFHKQVAHFKDRYRVITYDHRGQGRSEVTDSGYDMDNLYEDAAQLIEELKLGPVHFAGLSMGGFVGMRLAARRPDLVKSLTLMETSALPEPFVIKYHLLNTIVRLLGVNVVTSPVMDIMFSDTFLKDPARRAERLDMERRLRENDKSIVRAVNGVITRKGIDQELANITCPTLIMVGTEDKATIPAKAEFMHQHIPQSKLVYIQNAGHSSSIEEPEQVNSAMDAFLREVK
jgi:pimeloyl-ACP methyl ester carboxylesterase